MQTALLLNATPRKLLMHGSCVAGTDRPSEPGFSHLLSNLRASGGTPEADAVAHLLRGHREQPVSWLAHAIVKRELIHFSWRSRLFLPLFQFDLFDMGVREGVEEVIGSLANFLDDWQLSSWFAEPNSWLRGCRPADLLRRDSRAVIEAAWTDGHLAPKAFNTGRHFRSRPPWLTMHLHHRTSRALSCAFLHLLPLGRPCHSLAMRMEPSPSMP